MGQLKMLEDLELSSLECLSHLPESLGQLKNLRRLGIFQCFLLTTLPEIIGQLENLTEIIINMAGSSNRLGSLQRLPESFGCLKRLQMLKITGCPLLTRLPDSFPSLSGLQDFVFDSKGNGGEDKACGLVDLPENFGQLKCLSWLELRNCFQLSALPESLGQLTSLKTLKLARCFSLTRLPESIGQLKGLEMLVTDKMEEDGDEG